jgi:site-specific DNA recombinase
MTVGTHSPVRCAIYTRKSSEEGLEQSFNSLHAQREACEAYIASQRHEGWKTISKKYDDGGFSGGNLNRPALKQLLDDIAARLIDTVVVYKVDRLTRSLIDFAKIVETFDQQQVSFVSVTQQFNTTSSMGRLTLNVLLSFAQFEREVTGERIRDKIAASKKKGMWMGGMVLLGYEVKDKRLVVNPHEARIVQEIFSEHLRLKSVAELKRYLDQKNIRTKIRTSGNGHSFGGQPYSRGGLYKLLNNEIYTGRIAHKGESYLGQHPAIIDPVTWEKVQALLAGNNRGQRQQGRKASSSVLAGLVFDADGNRYTPTHAVKNGKRYRYYTSQAVIQKRKKPSPQDRIPARQLEHLITSRIQLLLESPQELAAACTESYMPEELDRLIEAARKMAAGWSKLTSYQSTELVRHITRRILLHKAELELEIDKEALARHLLREETDTDVAEDRHPHGKHLLTLKCCFTLAHRRGELRLVLPGADVSSKPSSSLLKVIVMAHRWRQRIVAGDVHCREQLASEAKLNPSYVGRILRLGALSPEIVEGLLDESIMTDRSIRDFTANVPLDWKEQAALWT